MSTFTKVKLINPAGGDPVIADVGAAASNVTFSDSTNLQSAFVPFTGTDGTNAGTKGLVPAPAVADDGKFLKSDGTWGAPAGGVSSVNSKTGVVTLDASDVGAIASTEKGAASGVAELDATGKVPSSQLPSYVDDVVEAADFASLPATGETGKIYITLDDNKTYRWSGTAYVEISASLALGETSSTAYRGDYGKVAHDHATDASRLTTAQASDLYKVAVTAEGHIASVTAVQKSDITALGIPGSDTNTTYTTTSGNVGSASGWSAGSVTAVAINGDTLEITAGVAPSLTVTSTSVVTAVTADT